MNVLFITLLDIRSIYEHNIYSDLMREFAKDGHDVTIISPIERRYGIRTHILEEAIGGENNNVHILKLKIGNVQKTNVIEKGISTILMEENLKTGIKKYFSRKRFDLVLYSTPPITVGKVVKYVKNRDKATTYLLLKDIFPQNAVDLGMLSKKGVKSILYRYFRKKEKELYKISDKIGCMSPANVEYVKQHNPEIDSSKLEVCPNCIDVQELSVSIEEKLLIRKKYNLPLDKKIFVYGGNLGKPQGIDFLIECLKSQLDNQEIYFLIVGNGTEFNKLNMFIMNEGAKNVKLMESLPKDEYDRMIASCDVGMIFLDYRFSIPNFPSRLLSYMQASIPVLACTDINSDVGKVIVDGEFGWWCESCKEEKFDKLIKKILTQDDWSHFSASSRGYLIKEYNVKRNYEIIIGK